MKKKQKIMPNEKSIEVTLPVERFKFPDLQIFFLNESELRFLKKISKGPQVTASVDSELYDFYQTKLAKFGLTQETDIDLFLFYLEYANLKHTSFDNEKFGMSRRLYYKKSIKEIDKLIELSESLFDSKRSLRIKIFVNYQEPEEKSIILDGELQAAKTIINSIKKDFADFHNWKAVFEFNTPNFNNIFTKELYSSIKNSYRNIHRKKLLRIIVGYILYQINSYDFVDKEDKEIESLKEEFKILDDDIDNQRNKVTKFYSYELRFADAINYYLRPKQHKQKPSS